MSETNIFPNRGDLIIIIQLKNNETITFHEDKIDHRITPGLNSISFSVIADKTIADKLDKLMVLRLVGKMTVINNKDSVEYNFGEVGLVGIKKFVDKRGELEYTFKFVQVDNKSLMYSKSYGRAKENK